MMHHVPGRVFHGNNTLSPTIQKNEEDGENNEDFASKYKIPPMVKMISMVFEERKNITLHTCYNVT